MEKIKREIQEALKIQGGAIDALIKIAEYSNKQLRQRDGRWTSKR